MKSNYYRVKIIYTYFWSETDLFKPKLLNIYQKNHVVQKGENKRYLDRIPLETFSVKIDFVYITVESSSNLYLLLFFF